jgi:hypothetical protein
MSEPTIALSVLAHGKMVLHAMKHSSQPVAGLLVGKTGGAAGSLYVVDVVPLCHTVAATLPHPILEVGIMQAHATVRASGCSIVGSYVVNERPEDEAVSELTKKFVQHMQVIGTGGDGHPTATPQQHVLLMLTATAFTAVVEASSAAASTSTSAADSRATGNTAHGIKPFNVRVGGGVTELPAARVHFSRWNPDTVTTAAVPTAEALAKVGRVTTAPTAVQRFFDFEEHLDNCMQDYDNTWLAAQLE